VQELMVMQRKRIKPGQLVGVRLTPQERDLILERTLIDDEMAGRLRVATARGSDLVVRLTLDDVDDLAGHVAAEANHCSEARVRRVLNAVHDRLASIEHTFTDGEGPAETVVSESKPFTAKQGQYLAYIYYYTKILEFSDRTEQARCDWEDKLDDERAESSQLQRLPATASSSM
jgi:hypothetical protein